MATAEISPEFDRVAAVKQFDETRTGVKGLVDSGVSSVPLLFRQNPDLLRLSPSESESIPTIDLSLPHAEVVDLVRAASHDWGFFQVINHGIPASTIDKTLSAIRSFNELPSSERSPFYSRDISAAISYVSNVDLYKSSAASWRDSIHIITGPTPPDKERLPPICGEEILTWDEQMLQVCRTLLGLMSEGLGVSPKRLEDLTIDQGRVMVCQYYPPCPEPDVTLGVVTHTDPDALTLLVQDSIGGLQVKRTTKEGDYYWVDVVPIPGALVVNIGDMLQIISNDEYKSVEHRAVMRSRDKSRVSIGVFFRPPENGDSVFYGPLPELISHQRPSHYREFTVEEFMGIFLSDKIATKAQVDHFKM